MSSRLCTTAVFGALMLAAVVSSCGFQMRGALNMPESMANTYIESGDRHSQFYLRLRDVLHKNGVNLVDAAVDASAVLQIRSDETGQRVLSVSAGNIPREYEVFYSVDFALNADSVQVLAPQLVTLTRDYTYDETQVLGKALEEESLRVAIVDDLVRIVMRRLETAQ